MTEASSRETRDDRARASFGPFDPLTAISELQAQGIRAAGDVAQRIAGLLNSAVAPPRPEPRGTNGNGRASVGDLRGAVGRLTDLYSDVLQRTFDAYADLLEERARVGPHLDGGPEGTVRVEITPGGGDREGSGELWLGNATDVATGALRMVATDLVNADGCIPAASVVLDPAVLDPLAPGAAARIAVSITIGSGADAGFYHGYVLVPELPGEALPLTLLVHPPPDDEGSRDRPG
jgi:hypothetical protein